MNTNQVQAQHEVHEEQVHEEQVHEEQVHEEQVHEEHEVHEEYVQSQRRLSQQVQEQEQEPKFDIDTETKKLMMDRDFINKAIQMASTNKFTGEHYILWREIIDCILLTADLWFLFEENKFKRMKTLLQK